MFLVVSSNVAAILVSVGTAAVSPLPNFCLSPDAAREAFKTKELVGKDYYEESHGARVQREHPNTYMFSQTKYVTHFDAAICNYSNHVGLVFVQVFTRSLRSQENECNDASCRTSAHWREEWTESTPNLDRPGEERLLVCMEERDGVAYPSVGCSFFQAPK